MPAGPPGILLPPPLAALPWTPGGPPGWAGTYPPQGNASVSNGLIGNRNLHPRGWVTANTTATYRIRYPVDVAATNLQLTFPAWATVTAGTGDEASGNTVTIGAAYIEYLGVLYPVTFAGATSYVIPSGGSCTSDPVAGLTVSPGTVLYARTYVTVPGGGRYPDLYAIKINPDEIARPGANLANATGDLSGTGSTISDLYGPDRIVGDLNPSQPAYALAVIGDSIVGGGNDAVSGPEQLGYYQRALYPGTRPYVICALPGEKALDFLTQSDSRVAYIGNVVDYAITEHAINDMQFNAATLAQVQARVLSVASTKLTGIPAGRIYQQTITPKTSSTDGWVTTANQSVTDTAMSTTRVDFNNWVRDGMPVSASTGIAVPTGTVGALRAGSAGHPFGGYIEVADLAETSRDSCIWRAGYTTDGLHPNAAANIAIAAALDLSPFKPITTPEQAASTGGGGGGGTSTLVRDASSPAMTTPSFVGTQSSAWPSNSFSPPAGSVLVVTSQAFESYSSPWATPTITDSLGSHLAWHLVAQQADTAVAGYSTSQAVFWAYCPSAQTGMTVTVTQGTTDVSQSVWYNQTEVSVWTGADTTAPIGATAQGAATGTGCSTSLTPQGSGSALVMAFTNNDNTSDVSTAAGTGDYIFEVTHYGPSVGQLWYGNAAGQTGASSAQTLAVTGISARWQYIAYEVKAASTGATIAATAALTTTASLTALATREQPATATLTTTAALTAPATQVQPATAALSTSVTLAAPATPVQPATAALSTSVTLAAPATQVQPATAALTTTATLSATPSVTGIQVRAGSNATASATSVAVPYPAGTTTGDVCFVALRVGAINQTVSQSAGTGTWTIVSQGNNTSGGYTYCFAYRVVGATDTAPTFAWSGTNAVTLSALTIYSVEGSTIGVDAWASDVHTTVAGNSVTPGAVAAAGTGEASVILTVAREATVGTAPTTFTYTPPTGWATSAVGASVQWTGTTNSRFSAVAAQVGRSGTVTPGAQTLTDDQSGGYFFSVGHALVSAVAVAATAALSTTATLTAGATQARPATAALATTATLTAGAVQVQPAAAALTTTASLGAPATPIQPATAALSTTVALAAATVLARPATAALTTTATLTAPAIQARPATAALTTTASLTATVATTATLVTTVNLAAPGVPWRFVTRQGTQLYRYGTAFTFGAGLNLYYAAARTPRVGSAKALGANDSKLATALATLDTVSGGKLKVIRFWAYQNLAVTSGVRDWAALDHVFSVAAANGFLLIPVLADEWGDVGDGGAVKTVDWFTTDYASTVGPNDTVPYRAWVAEVTARYANQDSILCWMFINEGSPYADTSQTLLDDATGLAVNKAWAKDIADVVRANDSNHLLCNGLNYNNSGTKNYTTAYEDIIAYDGTDIFQYHDYAGGTANTTSGNEVTDLVNLRLKSVQANKVFIVGEVGVRIDQGALRDDDYDGKLTRYAVVPAGQSVSAYAGALPWVYNDTVDYMGSYTSIDDLYDLRPDADSASFAVFTAHGSAVPAPATNTAALATTAALTATATQTRPATAALSTTATLAATATQVRPATAALTTTASLTATAVQDRPAAAALTTTASLAAPAVQGQPATAALATTVALAATAVQGQPATVTLTTTTQLTATAVREQPATAALTTTVTLAAPGTLVQVGGAALATTPTLAATAVQGQPATATLQTAVALTAAATQTWTSAAALATTVTLTAPGNVGTFALLTTAASMTAAVTQARAASAALSTTATLAAAAVQGQPGVVALATSVTITVTATQGRTGTGALTTAATITVVAGTVGTAALATTVTLAALGVREQPALAALSTAVAITATATWAIAAGGQLTTTPTLTAAAALAQATTAQLATAATLSAAGRLTLAAGAQLVTAVTLAALAQTHGLVVPGYGRITVRERGAVLLRPGRATIDTSQLHGGR